MPTPDRIFAIANTAILVPWALLLFVPGWKWTQRIAAIFVPLLLAVAYFLAFIREFSSTGGGFGTLQQVMLLFDSPWVTLAGWLHYLAFDLFTGAWIVRDAKKLGIAHFALAPILILTLMLGPIGLGLYLGLRFLTKRQIDP